MGPKESRSVLVVIMFPSCEKVPLPRVGEGLGLTSHLVAVFGQPSGMASSFFRGILSMDYACMVLQTLIPCPSPAYGRREFAGVYLDTSSRSTYGRIPPWRQ